MVKYKIFPYKDSYEIRRKTSLFGSYELVAICRPSFDAITLRENRKYFQEMAQRAVYALKDVKLADKKVGIK